MELIVERTKRDKVFTFENKLGVLVWEAEPITRFKFSKPVENEWLQEQLSANKATCGIVFNGFPIIGTNDGFIYNKDEKIQRIPDIKVDPEIFMENYAWKDYSEKLIFDVVRKRGFGAIDISNNELVRRMIDIEKEFRVIAVQEDRLEAYVRGYLGIRGFANHKEGRIDSGKLYDAHILGITETGTGKVINPITPHALYQITADLAGFVPHGYPPVALNRTVIEDGREKKIDVYCVDYHDLWLLNGQGRIMINICPRDGSGYAPAKFATNGTLTAISHGDHPEYVLDIMHKNKDGTLLKVKSVDLDPQYTPQKLSIKDKMVLGDYGNSIREFMSGKDTFKASSGTLTSFSDSELCTVKEDNMTAVYDIFTSKKLDIIKGDYVFLEATPQ